MMMLYSIRDLKTGFLPPFTDKNDETAIRGFVYALNKPGTLEYSNIQDYDLFKVGQFDSETGYLEPITPDLIYSGASILRGEKNE